MPTGAVTVDEVRARLGGAPGATDPDLEASLDSAVAHITALLDPAWADPDGAGGSGTPWPADLHDGVLLGAVLTYRNAESPTPSAAVEGGQPIVPPIAWDRWTRHRLSAYVDPGVWAG